jgi:autotransporter-associated beta strand protein
MRRSLLTLLLVASSNCAAWAFEADDHWTRTATEGSIGSSSSVGLPATLTWSFPADGTQIPGISGGTTPSNLQSFLDTNWPGGSGSDLTQRPWFDIFEQSFARLGALSGLTFVYEAADTGTTFANTTAARGILGTRGDIRIGGRSYGSGSSTLASNYGPDYGEMMINTDKGSFFDNTANNFRGFRNTLMHEVMHGVGIGHVESSTSGFIIEPTISTSFDGPQLDDILALQRLYGDIHEKNRGNDVFSRATPLGIVTPAQSRAIGTNGATTVVAATHTDFVSIDDELDTDFFKFTLQQSLDVSLALTPQGTTYMVGDQGETQASFNTATLSDLTLSLISGNGSTVLATANLAGLGAGESIVRQLDPGDYYARVTGAQNNIQLYKLLISALAPAAEELIWMGSVNNQWDVGATANFVNRDGADEFQNGDSAWFDNRATVRDVTIAENVSPETITIATEVDSEFVFSGPGGIVDGSLTATGSGRVELANSGNSYSGATQVMGGTLAITGDAGAMVSAIEVGSGATLVLDPLDAGAMASTISISAGGTLQIGTTASERNVFPDSPAGVLNNGLMRILDAERISGVSGNGEIVAEQIGVELADNSAFEGLITVTGGASVEVSDPRGLGTAAVQAAVEEGGALLLDLDGPLDQIFSIAGDGDGQGALRIAEGRNVELAGRLTGSGLIAGDLTIWCEVSPGPETARLEFSGDLTLASGSILQLEVGGALPAAANDELLILGSATLGGRLDVELLDGFTPTLGDQFDLLRANEVLGTFDDVLLPALSSELEWHLAYLTDAVVLTVADAAVLDPADFNGDGFVDGSDLSLWASQFGQVGETEPITGDADGDLMVDGFDFLTWQRNLTPTNTPEGAAAVPEPAALALMLLSLAVLWPLARRPRLGTV